MTRCLDQCWRPAACGTLPTRTPIRCVRAFLPPFQLKPPAIAFFVLGFFSEGQRERLRTELQPLVRRALVGSGAGRGWSGRESRLPESGGGGGAAWIRRPLATAHGTR